MLARFLNGEGVNLSKEALLVVFYSLLISLFFLFSDFLRSQVEFAVSPCYEMLSELLLHFYLFIYFLQPLLLFLFFLSVHLIEVFSLAQQIRPHSLEVLSETIPLLYDAERGPVG